MDFTLIKTIASSKSIRLEDLAKKANIKRATFFNYLSGKTSMPADVLKTISDILEIPVARLYEESNNLEPLVLHEPSSPYITRKRAQEVPLVHKFAYQEYLIHPDSEEFVETLPKYPVLMDQPAKGYYLCFEVCGDDMWDGSHESRIEGDIVLARKIQKQHWTTELTQKWNFFIIHRTEGLLFKRVDLKGEEGDIVIARSINTQYDAIELPKSDILALFREVKLVSRTLGR